MGRGRREGERPGRRYRFGQIIKTGTAGNGLIRTVKRYRPRARGESRTAGDRPVARHRESAGRSSEGAGGESDRAVDVHRARRASESAARDRQAAIESLGAGFCLPGAAGDRG